VLGQNEPPVGVEAVAEPFGARVDRAAVEQPAGDRHRQLEVAPGGDRQTVVGQRGRLVADRVDQDHLGAAPLRVLEHGHQVHVADGRVLAPQHDVAALQQVEEVVAVRGAQVDDLCGFAGTGADVADLAGARPELIEEAGGQGLEDPERAPGPIVEDRCRT